MGVPRIPKWSATSAYSSVGSATITNDSILNEDINSAAGIAFSKLAALDSAKILVGSAGNVATKVAMSGDATIDNAGAVTIANSAITNAKVSASAAIAYSKLNLSGSILNADVASGAEIAHSKLANTTAGYMLIGNASGVVTGTAMSGDATLSSGGVIDIAANIATNITGNVTGASGAALLLTPNASQDMVIHLGDNAGARKVSIVDSDDAEVFKIDSNGAMTAYSTLTMPTTVAITADTINAIASKSLKMTGVADYHIINKLGDADGHAAFKVTDNADVELLKLDSTGVFTLENGATLTNSSAADTLTITETNIELVGVVKPSSVTTAAINAVAGGSITSTGADGFHIINKLGHNDGNESFKVQNSTPTDLFTVESQNGNANFAGTVTMATTKALTLDTINSIASKSLKLTGVADYHIINKLGDADGHAAFKVTDSADVELLKLDSTGVFTLENGATLTNSSAVDTLTITETNIALSGAVTANSVDAGSGAVTTTGGVTGGTLTGKAVLNEASHDYAAGTTDWTLSATEMKKDLLIVTNAGGAVNIIAPETRYRYAVRNQCGANVTIMKAAGAGVTIANNKTAEVMYSSTVGDYARITADAAH